jgi:hypothetical protein
VLGVVAASWLAGCGPRLTDDVRVRIEGAYLQVENRSGGDVHVQLVAAPLMQAYVPASLPGNRVETGRYLRQRIAPSQWGRTLELHWWRPGEVLDASGIRGPDRIRRLPVVLAEPQPLPIDEQAVRACIAARQAQRRPSPRVEQFCIDEAERCLNTGAGLCEPMLRGWQAVEREALAQRAPRAERP